MPGPDFRSISQYSSAYGVAPLRAGRAALGAACWCPAGKPRIDWPGPTWVGHFCRDTVQRVPLAEIYCDFGTLGVRGCRRGLQRLTYPCRPTSIDPSHHHRPPIRSSRRFPLPDVHGAG